MSAGSVEEGLTVLPHLTKRIPTHGTHGELEGLDFPPIPGELGKKIWLNVSKEAWQSWQQLQTMMVNEYQLNLSDPNVRKHLLNQCDKYFFGDGVGTEAVPNYVPPTEAK